MLKKKENNTKTIILKTLTLKGNKYTSEKLFDQSIRKIQKTSLKNSKSVIKISLKNISPVLSSLKIRKRKTITLVPFFLKKSKRLSHAIKLIVKKSQERKKKEFISEFSEEILSSSNNKGYSKSTVLNSHVSSFMNKNFSNFRWFS